MGKAKVKIKAVVARAKKVIAKKGAYVPQVQLNLHIHKDGTKRS